MFIFVKMNNHQTI